MFKEILQFSLVVALVVAGNSSEESGEEREKSEGLCLDPKEIAFWCTAGTPLGDKLVGAFNSCFNAEEEEEPADSKEGKGKGNRAAGDFCPSFDEVEAYFLEDYQGKRKRVSDLSLPATPPVSRAQ